MTTGTRAPSGRASGGCASTTGPFRSLTPMRSTSGPRGSKRTSNSRPSPRTRATPTPPRTRGWWRDWPSVQAWMSEPGPRSRCVLDPASRRVGRPNRSTRSSSPPGHTRDESSTRSPHCRSSRTGCRRLQPRTGRSSGRRCCTTRPRVTTSGHTARACWSATGPNRSNGTRTTGTATRTTGSSTPVRDTRCEPSVSHTP
jgi:hypothetical protein